MIQRITAWGLLASILVRGYGIDSEFGRSIVEAAHRALAYASCVDIGNFKEVPGRPRPSFAPFAANGQALQGVHQIIVRSGRRRSCKTSDTRRNRTGRPLTQVVLTLSNFSPIYHLRLTIHHRRTTIPNMPHASQRRSPDINISNRVSAADWAFDGSLRTLSSRARAEKRNFARLTPFFLYLLGT